MFCSFFLFVFDDVTCSSIFVFVKYEIFTYIWLMFVENLGKYSIHGWYGKGNKQTTKIGEPTLTLGRSSVHVQESGPGVGPDTINVIQNPGCRFVPISMEFPGSLNRW